jgi:hypothetical protein
VRFWTLILLLVCILLGTNVVVGQASDKRCPKKQSAKQASVDQSATERRAKYPKEWEREVPKGTKLDFLRRELDRQIAILPEQDLEDRSPLPVWFRVYLRKKYPDLPTSGPYQYPRTAQRILQRLLDNPDSADVDSK